MTAKKTTKKSTKTKKAKTMKTVGTKRSSSTRKSRVKTTAKKPAFATTNDGHEKIGSIKGILLLEYKAALAEHGEARALQATADVILRVESSKPQYQLINQLLQEVRSAKVLAKSKADDLLDVQKQIAKKLEFSKEDFDNIIINEETGAIFFAPENSS